MDPAVDEISRAGTTVKLEPRAMRVLCVLAERAGEVCSADLLLDRAWPGVVVAQGSVYQVVATLRRALADHGETPRYIATVPRKGYRLVAPVGPWEDAAPSARPATAPTSASAAAPAPAPELATTPASAPTPETATATATLAPPASRRLLRSPAALLAAVLAVAGLAAWYGPRLFPEPPAVRVVPIVDLSDDGSGRSFAIGLTQEMVRVLGAPGQFRVISSEQPAGANAAGHVLEGSVRLREGHARITLQLVDPRDGTQIWANSFDRAQAQSVGVQAEVARSAARALERHFAGEGPPPVELSAYDSYLLGRRQQLLRQSESIDRAIHHYGRALAADPEFALAHAGLGEAFLMTYWYQNAPFEGAVGAAETAIERSLELDPELAEAYAARAMMRIMQWRSDEAIADLQRAIAINPNLGEAYQRLGIAYDYAARPTEALAAYEALLALDPLHTNGHIRRGLILADLGRPDEGARALARAAELQPELPNPLWARGVVHYEQGELPDAVRAYRQALARAPHRTDLHRELALLYLDVGDFANARAAVAAAAARARPGDPELVSAQAFVDAAAQGAEVLRPRVAGWRAIESKSDATRAIELAGLALAAGEPAGAAAVLQGGVEPALKNTYSLAWGTCEPCTYAAVAAAAGSPQEAERRAESADAWLAQLRAAGYVLHGMDYAEALRAAADGRRDAALDALERAYAQGWRRAWMLRLEPAFAPLLGEPRLRALVARVERDAAAARASLAASR